LLILLPDSLSPSVTHKIIFQLLGNRYIHVGFTILSTFLIMPEPI